MKWYENPLFLPKGSVRAIMALLILLTVCYITYSGQAVNQFLSTLAGTIVGYYFGSKKEDKHE